MSKELVMREYPNTTVTFSEMYKTHVVNIIDVRHKSIGLASNPSKRKAWARAWEIVQNCMINAKAYKNRKINETLCW
jgi:hypothetical protein